VRAPARPVVAVLAACLVAACAKRPPAPSAPALDERAVTELVGVRAMDRAGWAQDIVAAIRATGKEPTAERACAVIAVIEQESGYQPDPVVPDLPRIVMEALEQKLARLGWLAKPTLNVVLDRDLRARIRTLRTERDLDRLFRDTIAAKLPPAVVAVVGIDALNPVTTAGSMQVQVAFARRRSGLGDAEVRELLYTRAGGVYFGTARLISYPAGYDDVVYRFADYNAGVYASRNAAFQEQLARLTGTPLALDGDLLAYKDDVDSQTLKAAIAFGAAHGVSERRVRRDFAWEKTQDFEATETWRAVRDAWQAQTATAPRYARQPDVTLVSPKLSRQRTTAWFAESVKRRYVACRQRQGRGVSGGGLQVEEERGKQLGDRRMDRHGPAQGRPWLIGVHDVENAVDRLVAAGAEDGRAEDALRVGVDDDLHETAGLALLDGAADARHRPCGDQ
jgi:hypothetical protein